MCSSDGDEPPPPANAPAEVTVEAEAQAPLPVVTTEVEAQHGGTVVVAEDHAVEVVAAPSGEVSAYVLHVEGTPPPPADRVIVVNVYGEDRAVHPVELHFDASVGHYRGRLVRVRPAPGPLDVVVTVSGRPRRGRVARYVVVERPHAHVDVRVEAPRPRANVNVEVHHPGVNVHVEGHRPGRHVVVHGPRPRGHVVVHGARPRGRVHVSGSGNVHVRARGGRGGRGMR